MSVISILKRKSEWWEKERVSGEILLEFYFFLQNSFYSQHSRVQPRGPLVETQLRHMLKRYTHILLNISMHVLGTHTHSMISAVICAFLHFCSIVNRYSLYGHSWHCVRGITIQAEYLMNSSWAPSHFCNMLQEVGPNFTSVEVKLKTRLTSWANSKTVLLYTYIFT